LGKEDAVMPQPCLVKDLGLIDYEDAFKLQKAAVADVQLGEPQKIFLCEHPTVLTLGRMAAPGHILYPADVLAREGIKVIPVDRGGEVTLHAPGQLVVYPILDLNHYDRDLKRYLYKLEQVAIDLFEGFDILADRFSGRTGVWFGTKKIVSIGVGVKKWVSYHGLGINVNTDLKLFRWIRPCGMDVAMTSLAEIKGQPLNMSEVKMRLIEIFAQHFDLEVHHG